MVALAVLQAELELEALYGGLSLVPPRPDALAWAREHAIIRTASGAILRYADVAREYQDAILADTASRIIVAKSRQIGISQVVAFIVALEGVSGGTAVVVSRNEDQAVKFLRYVRTVISRMEVTLAHDNTKSLVFANGGSIEVQAATRGAGRGTAYTLAVLDEMAWMDHPLLGQGAQQPLRASVGSGAGRSLAVVAALPPLARPSGLARHPRLAREEERERQPHG